MCGIAGIFAYADSAPGVERSELARVSAALVRRGPDGEGLWHSPDARAGFAHRRLAIIDLTEGGAQPMATPDGRFVVTYNGEIFNHVQLRRELEAEGCVFRSASDTEVLLQLYERHGAAMVTRLRGMFAFAIWDRDERSLFLARDGFGIKPIYYADDGRTLRFASQVKALLGMGGVDATPEPAGAVGFLLWGCVPEPFTMHRGIRALPAGSTLTLRVGAAPSIEAHFDLRAELLEAQGRARAFRESDREELHEYLRDSLRHHLVADVPVAAFLSSGVDSNLIVSLAAEEPGVTLRTLTLGFEQYRGTGDDEVPLAERAAAALGAAHRTHWMRREDFEEDRAAILEAMDQPTTDGINTWFVCRAAARQGLKVALSGLGGDELFGGYPSFLQVPRIARWLKLPAAVPLLGRLARAAASPLLPGSVSPKFAGLLEYGGTVPGAYLLRRALFMPWELRAALDPVTVHVGLERLRTLPALAASIDGIDEPKAGVAALEAGWYMKNQLLRDADWAGMAHSVEVRVPFVDVTLFRKLAPWIVSGTAPTKRDAAAALRRPIAPEILERRKSGFSVPVREWLGAKTRSQRGLRDWALHVMPPRERPFRALFLATEAYGGNGGIAKFNRDLIGALASMPECAEVVVVPRLMPLAPEPLPRGVTHHAGAAGGKARFALAAAKSAFAGPFDLVVVGHINLTTLGFLLAAARGARSALVIHGLDAWSPHRSLLVRTSIGRMDRIFGVSRFTLAHFGEWARAEGERFRLLPNSVDMSRFLPGPKPHELEQELGLEGRKVVMTLGRLAAEERWKGFDEVIEALPALARDVPSLAYLICGSGPDRERLEAKAASLGVAERVVFAGQVAEDRKPLYYRLADAYVMPSRAEGFGIVFLEALSCGLPTVGSTRDGSREALMDGVFGALVDPLKPEEVKAAILAALSQAKRVPPELQHFSVGAFNARAWDLTRELLGPPRAGLREQGERA